MYYPQLLVWCDMNFLILSLALTGQQLPHSTLKLPPDPFAVKRKVIVSPPVVVKEPTEYEKLLIRIRAGEKLHIVTDVIPGEPKGVFHCFLKNGEPIMVREFEAPAKRPFGKSLTTRDTSAQTAEQKWQNQQMESILSSTGMGDIIYTNAPNVARNMGIRISRQWMHRQC